MFKAVQVQSWLFLLPASIFKHVFHLTSCGTLYLQLLAVKPEKQINSKNSEATDFVKKLKHHIQKKLGGLKLVFHT